MILHRSTHHLGSMHNFSCACQRSPSRVSLVSKFILPYFSFYENDGCIMPGCFLKIILLHRITQQITFSRIYQWPYFRIPTQSFILISPYIWDSLYQYLFEILLFNLLSIIQPYQQGKKSLIYIINAWKFPHYNIFVGLYLLAI